LREYNVAVGRTDRVVEDVLYGGYVLLSCVFGRLEALLYLLVDLLRRYRQAFCPLLVGGRTVTDLADRGVGLDGEGVRGLLREGRGPGCTRKGRPVRVRTRQRGGESLEKRWEFILLVRQVPQHVQQPHPALKRGEVL